MTPLLSTSSAGPADEALHARQRYERSLMNLSELLAHRIRSQLSCIAGYTNLLMDTLGDADQRELSFRIIEGVSEIEGVLGELQHFSRPIRPMRGRTCLGDILQRVFEALDDDELQRVALDLRVASDQELDADAMLVIQALLTLVQNALESQSGKPIRLAVHACNTNVCFEVWSESTPDVTPEVLGDPFYTTKAQNFGLGLHLARRIAEAHDGRLDQSAGDGQTCFRLEIARLAA